MRKLALVLLLCLIASPASPATDKWGGDDRATDSATLYQTGTITAIDNWTLTDSGKSWADNSLAGQILQPDNTVEVYYLIKANTSTVITVWGSVVDADEDRAYRVMSDDGAIGETYAVLNQWKTKKINSRWWLIDPYGNSFYAKMINNFDPSLALPGTDKDGTSQATNLISAYGASSVYEAWAQEIDRFKAFGFNSTGSINQLNYNLVPGVGSSVTAYTAARYSPFMAQIRIEELTLDATASFTVNTKSIWDAIDADFQSDVQTNLLSDTGAKTDGIKLFARTSWASRFLTPYKNAKYSIAANPYYMGIDWGEEPNYLQSENSNEHMGYRILISAAGTDRKDRAITYLQSIYAAIGDLNTAWGSAFADWTALSNDTGTVINTLLSSEPYCRNYGTYNETNTTMKADLDAIASDFWGIYTQKVKLALDNVIAVHKLNFGPGYHGWAGQTSASFGGLLSPIYLFTGSVGNVDVIGIGDVLHAPRLAIDNVYGNMGPKLQTVYDNVGLPFYHESVWLTAEADSGITRTGTITALSATVMTDNTVNFQEALAATGVYDSAARFYLVLNNAGVAQGSRKFFRITTTGTGTTTLTVDYEVGPGTSWSWDATPDMTAYANVGDTYHIVSSDAIGWVSGGTYSLYLPMTQADRGTMFSNFITEQVALGSTDKFMVGFSWFTIYDYGFRNGGYEKRNFGFISPETNLYDGTATIANGEIQDTGDFVTPASGALVGLYDAISGLDPVAPRMRAGSMSGGWR